MDHFDDVLTGRRDEGSATEELLQRIVGDTAEDGSSGDGTERDGEVLHSFWLFHSTLITAFCLFVDVCVLMWSCACVKSFTNLSLSFREFIAKSVGDVRFDKTRKDDI